MFFLEKRIKIYNSEKKLTFLYYFNYNKYLKYILLF